MDIFSWAGLKVLDPKATGAKAFFVEVYFSKGSSSMRTAYPAAEKLASVMRAICLFGKGCLGASSQHRSRTLLISVSFSNRSGVNRTFPSLVDLP